MRAQSITASLRRFPAVAIAPKNKPKRPRAPLCWPWTADRPISRFSFGLTWEKHHEETFVYRIVFGGRGASGGFSSRRVGGHTVYRQRICSAGQFGPVCLGFRH